MTREWTLRHEWIAQFLMDDATNELAPCDMAYRIVEAMNATTPDRSGEVDKTGTGLPEGSSK